MSQDNIIIKGARENNLKNISLEIPRNKITVFTGVSGSGKSSLVFDTIATETQRQMNETYPAFIRGFLPKYSKPDADVLENLSVSIVVAIYGGEGRKNLLVKTFFLKIRLHFMQRDLPMATSKLNCPTLTWL